MNTYVPEVGDKVRAMLGENVLVGKVTYVGGEFGRAVAMVPDGVEDVEPWLLSDADGWHFEQVVSVPTKFGAVIRRADGEKFVLSSPGSFDCWYGGKRLGWTRGEHATDGGFTIEFGGVDE